MAKLASLTGYTVGSAGVTFGKIKQKIKLLGDAISGTASTTTPSTPKKKNNGSTAKGAATPASSSRKRKNAPAPTSDSANATPSKKANKGSAFDFGASAAVEHNDDNDDEELIDMNMFVKKEEPVDEEFSFLHGIGGYATSAGAGVGEL
jgi:cytoskeletal protein RodZ